MSPIAADTPQPWLRVARIARPQGHRGEVVADLLTDFPERFAGSPTVLLRAPRALSPSKTVAVERYRLHQGRVVLKLSGCDSMNDAELLRDFEVVVPWEQRMPLSEDEVYVAELAGCVLIDARTETPVGTITDVDRESSNTELLVVEMNGGREVLIPFVRAYLPRLDLEARTLRMHLPEGLTELEVGSAAGDADARTASSVDETRE